MRPFCDYHHSGGFGLFIRLVGLWLEVTCIKWNDNKLVHVYEKRETEPFDHCIGTASRVSRDSLSLMSPASVRLSLKVRSHGMPRRA